MSREDSESSDRPVPQATLDYQRADPEAESDEGTGSTGVDAVTTLFGGFFCVFVLLFGSLFLLGGVRALYHAIEQRQLTKFLRSDDIYTASFGLLIGLICVGFSIRWIILLVRRR